MSIGYPASLGRMRPRAASSAATLSLAPALLALTLGIALTLWALSLPAVARVADSAHPAWPALGLPGSWFLAAALLIGAAVLQACARTSRPGVDLLLLAAVVLVLFGTVPAVAHAPQYAWTYKHLGVTRSILAAGHVSAHGNVYDRWPGFFALLAAVARVTGLDPVALAPWFEPVLTLLDAVLVGAIACRVTGSARVASLASLFWVLSNWIGQDYFSPQGFAFTLSLVMLALIVGPARPSRGAISAVLGLDLAVVASHQLTPYMVVVQVAVLTLLGLGPRWLCAALATIALAYLAPNLGYMTRHYGVLGDLNPLAIFTLSTGAGNAPPFLAGHAGEMVTLTLGLLAVIGAVVLWRVGERPWVMTLVALAGAPFIFLAGNRYGGEGILRVILFSSPWLSVLGAWGLTRLSAGRGLLGSVLATVVLGGLFPFAFAGFAAGNVIPRDEVTAASYFYAHAAPGSVLVVAGSDFPTDGAANYAAFAGPVGDSTPSLLQDPRLLGHALGSEDLDEVLSFITGYSAQGYLVFSRTADTSASFFRQVPGGSLAGLEHAVATSPAFRLWYRNRDVRIYAVVGRP